MPPVPPILRVRLLSATLVLGLGAAAGAEDWAEDVIGKSRQAFQSRPKPDAGCRPQGWRSPSLQDREVPLEAVLGFSFVKSGLPPAGNLDEASTAARVAAASRAIAAKVADVTGFAVDDVRMKDTVGVGTLRLRQGAGAATLGAIRLRFRPGPAVDGTVDAHSDPLKGLFAGFLGIPPDDGPSLSLRFDRVVLTGGLELGPDQLAAETLCGDVEDVVFWANGSSGYRESGDSSGVADMLEKAGSELHIGPLTFSGKGIEVKPDIPLPFGKVTLFRLKSEDLKGPAGVFEGEGGGGILAQVGYSAAGTEERNGNLYNLKENGVFPAALDVKEGFQSGGTRDLHRAQGDNWHYQTCEPGEGAPDWFDRRSVTNQGGTMCHRFAVDGGVIVNRLTAVKVDVRLNLTRKMLGYGTAENPEGINAPAALQFRVWPRLKGSLGRAKSYVNR